MVCRAQPSVCAALVYPLFSISPGFNLVYAQYMEGYADLPTPSMGADWSYARLRQAQGPLAVFNNRTSADNPPHPKFHNNRAYDLVIFCEAFSFVKDRNILRPLLDTQRLFRPADGVIEFLETCTRSYATEAKRAQAMRGPLSKLLRRELGTRSVRKVYRGTKRDREGEEKDVDIKGAEADGVIEHEVLCDKQSRMVVLLVQENKNEQGSGGADPTLQAALTYEKIILEVSPCLLFPPRQCLTWTTGHLSVLPRILLLPRLPACDLRPLADHPGCCLYERDRSPELIGGHLHRARRIS